MSRHHERVVEPRREMAEVPAQRGFAVFEAFECGRDGGFGGCELAE